MEKDKDTKTTARNLRAKEPKLYTEEWFYMDDEEMGRGFRLEEKIETDAFTHFFVREMDGHNFTLAHIQKYGFKTPLLFQDKAGLGIRVPNDDFTVNHVKTCVGSRRVVDVLDVKTQKNHHMTLKEWVRYYQDPQKDRLYNVISLEFSHTKLEEYVESPTIVRQIDWVDTAWPSVLKNAQVESTNALDEMMYPKVQKYCLMSVKGCYTDFHIDFGGTSVWYHILKGQKIFWLIPPTQKNLDLFENWVLSGKQSDVFFGDTVAKCSRVRLYAGNTFFIPSGWIHAVYTPEDSLVFGGNFLHSFAIERQLQVARVERRTKVPQKFRYPFFTEMLWYVLEKYIFTLLGRNHLDAQQAKVEIDDHIHLTYFELVGLKDIVRYLISLAPNEKNVPDLIKDPIAVIKDVKMLVEKHRFDSPELSCRGVSALTGIEDSQVRPREKQERVLMSPQSKELRRSATGAGPRRRRTRCKKCEACVRDDCSQCSFCLDMVKFGGPGRAKQTCVMRQCIRPMLPVTAACSMCKLDGWGETPVIPTQKMPRDSPSSLMECSCCYEIAHPDCYVRQFPGIDGIRMSDLPNSWECPRCCKAGRNREYRPRHFRARAKSTEVSSVMNDDKYDVMDVFVESSDDEDTACVEPKRMKIEMKVEPKETPKNALEDRYLMMKVFKYLRPHDLMNCALVCRQWARWSMDPSLWRKIDVTHKKFTAAHLAGIARCQPEVLMLDWSRIAKKQLSWLISRLQNLQALSARGCHWAGISALASSLCPPLNFLDVSFVGGMNDSALRDILAPPQDSRPGSQVVARTRLQGLRCLKIAGCDISDISLRYITQNLPYLRVLDINSCMRLTDAGIAQLCTPSASTVDTLTRLDVSNLRSLTDVSMDHLSRLENLRELTMDSTPNISTKAIDRLRAVNEEIDIIGRSADDEINVKAWPDRVRYDATRHIASHSV